MIGAFSSAAFCRKTGLVSGVVSPMTTGMPALMMPAFSPAIFRQCIAQKLDVVETDISNDAQIRMNDVCAVQPAAQSRLQ